MTNKNYSEVVTTKKMVSLAHDAGDVMEVIQLINDLINFMPDKKDPKVQENPLFYYGATQEALGNVFAINQGLSKKLDTLVVELYDMAEELEEMEEDG